MKSLKINNTRTISILYFLLLLYTIAALVWWGILLKRQNDEIARLETEKFELQYSRETFPATFEEGLNRIKAKSHLHDIQYLGEGIAFLFIILLGAGFVFDAVRRQIRFSRQQQNLMLAVTHELKSPIAVLKLNIETMLRRTFPEEKQKYLMKKMLMETNRLDRLAGNILLSSRFENRQYKLLKDRINFSEIVIKICEEEKDRIKNCTLKWNVMPDIFVEGDVLMLHIVCNNLIENAEKYAPRGSEIKASVFSQEGKAILLVEDNGQGIPKNEKEKIFERFYRIGSENTRNTQGTGLGLFLTKKIILEHGGQITVKDNLPTGSVFEVRLPQAI